MQFALQIGALTKTEREALWKRVLAALTETGEAQQENQVTSDPVEQFMRGLSTVISSGRAYLKFVSGPRLINISEMRIPLVLKEDMKTSGQQIGWLAGDDVYLDPGGTYGVVQRLARETGEFLTVTQQTLGKRLREQGILRSTESARHTNTVRIMLEGIRRTVWHLNVQDVLSGESPTLE